MKKITMIHKRKHPKLRQNNNVFAYNEEDSKCTRKKFYCSFEAACYSLRNKKEPHKGSTTPNELLCIIIVMSCRRHGYPWPSLAPGRSSGLHPVSSHSCCMYVRVGRPAFARPYEGVHRSTSLMSSSLLLQQCPAYLVHLTLIIFVIGSRWPYSWCCVRCCLHDQFNMLAAFLCNCHLTFSPAV